MDDQLFEALQDLSEKTEHERDQFEQSYLEKEQSLEDMVRTQQELIEAESEQKRGRILEEQEQALYQFD